ncbi:MAG TPA: hypothetical protein VK527_12205, partial [Candidatus Limnocylindrales bacterium]|nr:hypothetical protein [Candidatus Limnocylindrales bacterium]
MNLPSSLALSQSKFFQSRLGIILLALVGLAIAAGIFLLRRQEPPAPVLPTAATSPAAQVRPQPVIYGPPAPSWARTDIQYGPAAPAEFLASATPAGQVTLLTPGPATIVPGEAPAPASVAGAQTQAQGAVAASQAATPAPAAAIGGALSGEIPKSVDASVLFARERYEYIADGRRDPFQSLIDGKFQTQSTDGSLIDVGDI